MAIDGTKILDSDFAWDLYDDFFERFDAGAAASVIQTELTDEYEGEIQSELDREIFLTTLAECLWQVGRNVEDLSEEVQAILDAETTTALWDDLWPERKAQLRRFVTKLKKPKKTPVKPKKRRLPKNVLFEEGDYLVFTKQNGKKIPLIIWSLERRVGLGYVFVFPNLTRTDDAELIWNFLDTKSRLSNEELAVFFRESKRTKCVTVDHSVCKANRDRFEKFGSRPFDFRVWQGNSFGYCPTFECFEKYANEGGSRGLTQEELEFIRPSSE